MRENPARFLSPNEELLLLRIARDSLSAYVEKQTRIALDGYALTPELEARHGVFVTLRRDGELRGCIGHTRSLEPLAEAVRDNAINAAVRDPRFPPVKCDACGEMIEREEDWRMDDDGVTACVAAFTETGDGPCYNEETSPPASD